MVEQGYEVCGIARTVAGAVALGRLDKPDLAVEDASGHIRAVSAAADDRQTALIVVNCSDHAHQHAGVDRAEVALWTQLVRPNVELVHD